MAEPTLGFQFDGLLAIRCGLVKLPIERIQVNGSAGQLNSFVKPTEYGCRDTRLRYHLETSGFESKRPLDGSVGSSKIEVNLSLNPPHLGMGRCQVRVQRQRSLNRFTRKPLTFSDGNNTQVRLPVPCPRQPDPSQGVAGIKLG